MLLDSKYDICQIVYLITDKDQNGRMVIGVTFRSTGVLYELSFNGGSSWHFEIEISEVKDIVKATSD